MSHQSDETFHEVLKVQFRLFTNTRCYFGVFPILVAVRPKLQNRMGAGTETGRRNCGEKFRDSELKLCFECFDPPQHLTNNKIEYESLAK